MGFKSRLAKQPWLAKCLEDLLEAPLSSFGECARFVKHADGFLEAKWGPAILLLDLGEGGSQLAIFATS